MKRAHEKNQTTSTTCHLSFQFLEHLHSIVVLSLTMKTFKQSISYENRIYLYIVILLFLVFTALWAFNTWTMPHKNSSQNFTVKNRLRFSLSLGQNQRPSTINRVNLRQTESIFKHEMLKNRPPFPPPSGLTKNLVFYLTILILYKTYFCNPIQYIYCIKDFF